MDAVLSPADESARKRLTYLGIALIVLAFLGPALGAALGLLSLTAFQVGEDSARTAGALLGLSLVSWLVTRKRSKVAQANGRVVVGLLLCITVVTNMVRAEDDVVAAKAFVLEAVKFRDENMATFAKLGERFDKIDLSKVLTPEGVATSAGLASSRAVIAQYRTLLAERNLVVQTYLTRYERFVNDRAPTGATRKSAFESMTESSQATAKLYGELDKTQTALADTLERVLDWGSAQAGRLGVEKGQLLFSTREQQAELQGLIAKVNEAEKVVNEVVAAATAAQALAKAQMADQDLRVKELMRK